MKFVAWWQAGRSVAAADIFPVVPCSQVVLEEGAHQSIRTVASQGLPDGGWLGANVLGVSPVWRRALACMCGW